jgi:2-methylcitrate dehydratase PrpD
VVVVPGAIGPAAAAARAMGLNIEQTAYALGCAMSAVPVSVANFGTDAHYFESALQSFQGIMSAQMAEKGMTSNPDIGAYLTALLGEDKVSPDRMVADLGEKWALRNIWIKKYPCCFLMHRQIDLLLEMRQKHNISYDDVAKIEVPISPADEPCNRLELETIGDLQFSYQHILGAALYDGDVNFSHIDSDILTNPKYQETRSKIDVISNPDWSDLIMVAPGLLTIKMKDGTEFSGERQYPIGAPQEPLAMDQFGQLYSKFTKDILSEEQIKETAEALLNLEKLNDIEKLMNVLTFR